eukprot:736123-Amphidinium_carterae.1
MELTVKNKQKYLLNAKQSNKNDQVQNEQELTKIVNTTVIIDKPHMNSSGFGRVGSAVGRAMAKLIKSHLP